MRWTKARSMLPILRAYLDGESPVDDDRNACRIAEFVIEKAMSGHFGYFTLVLDLVDGKLHRTAEDEVTFEAGCVLVMSDDRRDVQTASAA
jgi:hypothetical protein